ncbi:MAG: hypothetical protein ACP5LD_10555 [Desulfomonilaceae bacterium]
MAKPTSAEEMLRHYEQGTSGVSFQDYCGPQIKLGVSQAVCQARYNRYQEKVRGKGQKFITRWQGA